ncbi:MAG: alpha/beta hydrolase [Gammaproteobacteria bacterium]|nr:MAG: alpha/beta hydrolase [Gammaproteobacteria bacterium]
MHFPGILFLALAAAPVVLLFIIHVIFRAPRLKEKGSPADHDIAYMEARMPAINGKRLYGWWLPVPEADVTVVVMHGWGSNMELMLPLALPLHKAGLNVLLVDARNHGRSDSDSFSSMPKFAEDTGSAVDWLIERQPGSAEKIVLLGHSVGAGAVLLLASRRNAIAAVISIAAFAHPEWMMERYLRRFHIPGVLRRWVLRYVERIIGHRYEDIAPVHTACRADCPVLLVHGREDHTVPVSDARAIRDNCPEKGIELLLIDGAGHDSVESVEQHADELIGFLQRHHLL